MKRFLLLSMSILLFIAGCSGVGLEEEDIVQTDDENEDEVSIVPKHQLSKDQYKIILPYRVGAARGAITNQLKDNRLDINELEDGLRRHSTPVFDPEKLLFEEGQYISQSTVFDFIDELNPKVKEKSNLKDQIKEYEKNPRVFSHIVEQNYLHKKDDNTVELSGISIGISLKSVYKFITETGGPSYYTDISKKEMLEKGQEVAAVVLDYLREQDELDDVPILIALFREEAQSSPVPGSYVAKTFVNKGEVAIGDWETIDEEHVLIPSSYANKNYPEDDQKVKRFAEKIAEFFPNYVGVIGDGFYIDETLQRLSLEIPLEFYGRGEVVGFTQYVYGLVQDIFSIHYDIEIVITSSDGTESLIFRKSGEDEAKVHLFH